LDEADVERIGKARPTATARGKEEQPVEEDAIYEIGVLQDDGSKTVELLVPGYVIYEGDCYVDANARCVSCGKLKFQTDEDDEMCDCGDGRYDYDDSQHPVDLWLEEWVRDHYGPDAQLDGSSAERELPPHPLGYRALVERLGDKIARGPGQLNRGPAITETRKPGEQGLLITFGDFDDLSVEDMKNMLTPEQLADAERRAAEWEAERAALEAGRVLPERPHGPANEEGEETVARGEKKMKSDLWVGFDGMPTYEKLYPLAALPALRKVAMRACTNPKHAGAVEFHDCRVLPPEAAATFEPGPVRVILCAACCDEAVRAMTADTRLGDSIVGIVEDRSVKDTRAGKES